jgi:hypothetical protein
VFLLALCDQLDGEKHLVFYQTDHQADQVIRKVAAKRGVKLIDESLAKTSFYKNVFHHGWNQDRTFLKALRFENRYIYGDGLSNRTMKTLDEKSSGCVFWGSEILDKNKFVDTQSGNNLFVTNAAIAGVWSDIKVLMRLGKSRQEIKADTLLLAFRYWGSNTYLGISIDDIVSTLENVKENAPFFDSIYLAPDSRWVLPISQRDIVKKVFPGVRVHSFSPNLKLRLRLGHLANLDYLCYSHSFPRMAFFGFDGSLPLTFMLTQPLVKVIAPSWRPTPDLPSAMLIRENYAWQECIRTNNWDDALIREVAFGSESLYSALEISRGGNIPDNHISAVVKQLHRDWGRKNSTLLTGTAQVFFSSNRKLGASILMEKIRSLRENRLIVAAYFWIVRSLILRKAVVWISRRLD